MLQHRHLEEQRGDERRRGLQPADQQHGDAHEADDLTHARLAVHVQPGADRDDGDHRQRAGGARHHVDQRPPVQHRELMADHLLGDFAELLRLRRQPGEGLHHHHIGQRILRGAGQRGVVAFHPALAGFGLAHHQRGDQHEDHHQHDQHQRQPPVQQQRQRQQHHGGQEGGELVAEEHQPGAEQRIGAGQHDLDQPAGLGVAVERRRQLQHVLEVAPHRRDTVAVRQPLGLHRDEDVAQDAAQADAGPDCQQPGRRAPEASAAMLSECDSRLTTRPNSTGSRNCRPATIRLAPASSPATRMSRPSRPSTRA